MSQGHIATMKARSYQTAETVVFDPVTANRNATVASLHSLGFRNVQLASSFDSLSQVMEQVSPDLLLLEAAGSENEVCQLIQSIRQGVLGQNPFMVIVATTWRRDGEIVTQILNAGADDLLARPFSTVILSERIKQQIERRKNFVVTADYVGPDRRREPGRTDFESFEAPNSLQIRTDPTLTAEETDRKVARVIRVGRATLNNEKMRRAAFQLCLQWRLLETRMPGKREFAEMLNRIEALNTDISRRAAEAQETALHGYCQAIESALNAIRTMTVFAKSHNHGVGDVGPPLRLLGDAALSLGRNFSPNSSLSTQLAELDAVVARMDRRIATAS